MLIENCEGRKARHDDDDKAGLTKKKRQERTFDLMGRGTEARMEAKTNGM